MKLLQLGGLFMTMSLFAADSIHDFSLKSIDGQGLPLSSFKGKAVLLVNTASKCGYTPQYTGPEALHAKYKDRGPVVLSASRPTTSVGRSPARTRKSRPSAPALTT